MADQKPGNNSRKDHDLYGRAVRGAAWISIGQYGSLIIGLVKVAILARLVEPTYHGMVALAATYVSYFTLFKMVLTPIVITDPEGSAARLNVQFAIEVLTTLSAFLVAGLVAGGGGWGDQPAQRRSRPGPPRRRCTPGYPLPAPGEHR